MQTQNKHTWNHLKRLLLTVVVHFTQTEVEPCESEISQVLLQISIRHQRCHDGDVTSTKYLKEGVYYKYIGLDNCK